jgi:hypothetical protein
MRRVANGGRVPASGTQATHVRHRHRAQGARRTAASYGVTTLAQATALSLPSLEGIPAQLNQEINGERLYQLAAALAGCGFGSWKDWNEDKGTVDFVQSAVIRAITPKRMKMIEKTVEYWIELSDGVQRYSSYRPEEITGLLLKIACSDYGYLEMGSAVEAMEAEAKGLGVAFFRTLLHSIYPVMRVYDYTDALDYETNDRERAEEEEEDEENEKNHEIPDIKSELPSCIRETEDQFEFLPFREWRRLLLSHRGGKFRSWIKQLRRLMVLSRYQRSESKDFVEDEYYDDPPIPSLLIALRKHDGIVRYFDDACEYWAQGSPRPAVCIQFSPTNQDEIARTLRVAYRFIEFNCELSRLAEDIRRWEAKNARRRGNRGDEEVSAEGGTADLYGVE